MSTTRPGATWSPARPTDSWSTGSRPAAAPRAGAMGDGIPAPVPPYPEALYTWAWTHGAYYGIDPVGGPSPRSARRTIALTIAVLVAVAGLAAYLSFGLG